MLFSKIAWGASYRISAMFAWLIGFVYIFIRILYTYIYIHFYNDKGELKSNQNGPFTELWDGELDGAVWVDLDDCIA